MAEGASLRRLPRGHAHSLVDWEPGQKVPFPRRIDFFPLPAHPHGLVAGARSESRGASSQAEVVRCPGASSAGGRVPRPPSQVARSEYGRPGTSEAMAGPQQVGVRRKGHRRRAPERRAAATRPPAPSGQRVVWAGWGVRATRSRVPAAATSSRSRSSSSARAAISFEVKGLDRRATWALSLQFVPGAAWLLRI